MPLQAFLRGWIWPLAAVLVGMVVCLAGCRSPYYADQGALFGGLTGAGVGALVGNAVGNTGAGAVIGAGVGALSGAAIGSGLDEIEAENRARIEAHLGRQVQPGAVTINDVLAMAKAGVDEDLIVTHIRAHGVARPLQTGELIMLQQEGVSKNVIQALQSTPVPTVAPGPAAVGPPVIVEEHYYGPPPPPYWRHHYHYHHYHRRPSVGWGVSFSN